MKMWRRDREFGTKSCLSYQQVLSVYVWAVSMCKTLVLNQHLGRALALPMHAPKTTQRAAPQALPVRSICIPALLNTEI